LVFSILLIIHHCPYISTVSSILHPGQILSANDGIDEFYFLMVPDSESKGIGNVGRHVVDIGNNLADGNQPDGNFKKTQVRISGVKKLFKFIKPPSFSF
jgi:hypothetical protein